MSLRSTVFVLAGSILAVVAAPSVVEASCVPGFDYAAFGKNGVGLRGGAVTDSYDSSIGPYTCGVLPSPPCSPSAIPLSGGNICTNSTAAGTAGPPPTGVAISGATSEVNGSICIGTGGTPGTVISAPVGSYDSSSVLPAPVTLTSVTLPVPSLPAGSPASLSCATGAPTGCTLAPNFAYTTVTNTGSNRLIKVSAGTYVIDSLALAGSGTQIEVTSGPVVIYITTALSLTGGTVVNGSMKSTDMMFMVMPTVATIGLSGGSSAAYAVYAPDTTVSVSGGGSIYGGVVGKTVDIAGGSDIHYDKALANTPGGQFSCPKLEISRASPIIASIAGEQVIVQGTYEYPLPARTQITAVGDLTAFRFPYSQGHLRASKLSQFLGATVEFSARTDSTTGLLEADEVFDGKTLLPNASMSSCTAFNSSCRSVFTNTVGSIEPTMFNTANASAIGAKITAGLAGFGATEWATLVSRILAGNEVSTGVFAPKLGGLDRSTVAVIEQSLVAGVTRPKMIYVGGTDGMMHAFCGSASGACDVVGRELWAFVPRLQLQQLRTNLAIIDGSARVIDVYGDFNGDTIKGFATILLFTTGSGDRTTDRTPAVYALDITNPATPKIVWEYTMATPATPGAFELGHGQQLAAGPVMIGGSLKNAVFVQTNNGAALKDSSGTFGSGASGSFVIALDLETGAPLWTTPQTSTYSPLRVVTNAPVPSQAVPGGAVAVDVDGAGTLTDIVFGTLFGELWVLDATTGVSKFGTGPLFKLSADYTPIGAPPAIYSDGGSLYAVATTGSYWDRSSATMWNGATNQYIFGVKLEPTSTAFPFNEVPPLSADVPFANAFASGQKAASQALVVGGEIVFLTETGNINDQAYGTGSATGAAYKINLSGASTGSDVLVLAGVGSLASSGTALFASSGKGSEQLSFDAAGTTGETVNASLGPKVSRRLWLRTL